MSTKGFMESRFGFDFANVRIHTGPDATESAESINALAYTIGNQITFGEGRYKPHTVEGRQLLAHELTNVTQQNNNVGDVINRSPGPKDYKLKEVLRE